MTLLTKRMVTVVPYATDGTDLAMVMSTSRSSPNTICGNAERDTALSLYLVVRRPTGPCSRRRPKHFRRRDAPGSGGWTRRP